MSVIEQFKTAINFAIFQTKPNTYGTGSNLKANLIQCQSQFNDTDNYDQIDPNSSKRILEDLKRKINEKIKSLETKIILSKDYENKTTETLSSKISVAKKREKPELETRLNKKIQLFKKERAELELRLTELRAAIPEINKIISSATNYIFNIDKKPSFNYEDSTNTGIIKYDGTTGSLINELKHAFQFETGEIDFIKILNNNGALEIKPGLIYDLIDELETYKRQFAYDGILKLQFSITDEANGPITEQAKINKIAAEINSSYIEIKEMNNITVDVIVKIGDAKLDASSALYKNLPRVHLNINSPINSVINNNPKRQRLIGGLRLNKWGKEKPYIDFIKVFIKENPYIYVKN